MVRSFICLFINIFITDCYVALRLCERLDMITKDNLETVCTNHHALLHNHL